MLVETIYAGNGGYADLNRNKCERNFSLETPAGRHQLYILILKCLQEELSKIMISNDIETFETNVLMILSNSSIVVI